MYHIHIHIFNSGCIKSKWDNINNVLETRVRRVIWEFLRPLCWTRLTCKSDTMLHALLRLFGLFRAQYCTCDNMFIIITNTLQNILFGNILRREVLKEREVTSESSDSVRRNIRIWLHAQSNIIFDVCLWWKILYNNFLYFIKSKLEWKVF